MPEFILDRAPHRAPRVRFSLPAQTDLEQLTDILLGKHQEGIRQVQTDDVIVAGQSKKDEVIRGSPPLLNTLNTFRQLKLDI